ncbi:hypothetical protein GOODEAATRI_001822, partial [Goodea atripinnis]
SVSELRTDASGAVVRSQLFQMFSHIQLLRVLVNERLSAAADEIFEVVRKTISGYEEELLLSKQELYRQRRMLQGVAESRASQDEPQLTLCVWDEDFSSDHQQKEERQEPDWSSDSNRDPSSPCGRSQAERRQELEESSIIKVNITPPYVRNVISPTGFSEAVVKEEEEDPLPSTSTQQDVADGDSTSCSEADSEEEWRANSKSHSQSSSKKKKTKKAKKKVPRPPVAPKLNPTKKNKSQICCKVCGRAFLLTVSLVNHMEAHSKDICGVCGEHFNSEESFDAHLKTHVKAESCSVCGKCFTSCSGLEIHMRIHTGEKPFVCSECGKCFTTRANMVRHVRIHTGERPYTCTVCSRSFNDYTTLKRHLFVHSVKNSSLGESSRENGDRKSSSVRKPRAVCKVCSMTFHSVLSLLNHGKQHETDLCCVCGNNFNSPESLAVHLDTHKNGKCGKSFTTRPHLVRHSRIHTGERPYTCNFCNKSFNDYTTHKRHLLIHIKDCSPGSPFAASSDDKETGSTPKRPQVTCKVCGVTFRSTISLVNHAKSHASELCGVCGNQFDSEQNLKLHLKTHISKRVCDVCGKCFDSQGHLKVHLRVHTGEKPFACSECGKSFNFRQNMLRHARGHTGEKPYVCTVCGRGFSDRSFLTQHRNTHTGEKRHRCQVCGKTFNRKTYVRLHMMKIHTSDKSRKKLED